MWLGDESLFFLSPLLKGDSNLNSLQRTTGWAMSGLLRAQMEPWLGIQHCPIEVSPPGEW